MNFLARSVRSGLRRLRNSLPYQLKRRGCERLLPPHTIDNVRLVLAYYQAVKEFPTFVQIGACDGVSGDATCDFVQNGKMRSVLVEPISELYSQLSETYANKPNVTCIQAALALEDGEITLYKVKAGAVSLDRYWSSQLSSFSREHLLKHRIAPEEIEEVRVPAVTLSTLIDSVGVSSIDVLQIDTEGFDGEVVKMALGLESPPECINFENTHLSATVADDVFSLLESRGYVWTHDEWNTLALRKMRFGQSLA